MPPKRTEVATSEERYRTLFETIREGVALCELVRDPGGRAIDYRFIELNAGFAKHIGLPPAEVIGRTAHEVYPSLDPWMDQYVRAVEGGEAAHFERWFPELQTWYAVSAYPRGGDRFAIVYLEITEQKRVESELHRLNDELEVRVRERTSEIDALFARLVSTQEEERRRIARAIHDQLGQQMTALRINLEALRVKAGDREELVEQADRTKRLAEDLDRSIDFLTWELRPAALDHLGLPAALAHLVSGWSERFGIHTDYEALGVDGSRFAPEVEANLYRLTQEALHNVYKHAQAKRVSVVLEKTDGRLVLVLEDDGVGFAQTEHDGDGSSVRSFGLLTMRERAVLAGGDLTIESTPGQGTTLVVRVPVMR